MTRPQLNHQAVIQSLIQKTGGDRGLTQKAILQLIDADPAFLRALVDPFLPGIIAHALNNGAAKPALRPPASLPLLKSDEMERLVQGLSSNISETAVAPASPSRHADTMRLLAKAQADKRKK